MTEETKLVPPGRVLVFIVAFDAEARLAELLDRIPLPLWNSERVHFLCIDDASSDHSATLISNWAQERGIENLTVLRNPENQGYGGNQKLGYRLSLLGGFDFTIVLPGDGQYPPELLPHFIAVWDRTSADVVLGTRMQSLRRARLGGMPLHKVAGNRLMTLFQNALTGQGLSEYHTGYRGYASRFLRKVPFEINTNDRHFDTEILLQACYVGARIAELPVPIHYGADARHAGGLKYARDVVRSTVQFKMHRMGMLCSLKYRDVQPQRYQDKTHLVYSSHRMAADLVRAIAPKTVLDIGSGPGFVAKECEEMGARVTGIDTSAPLPGSMERFIGHDLERGELPEDPFGYDVVLLLDVLEHLSNPEHFLVGMRNQSQALRPGRPATRVLISTPNVAFAAIRANLLLGRFNYAERGILDISHKRLFTRATLVQTLRDCGYCIERVLPVGAPFEAVVPGPAGRLLGGACDALARLWPTLFAFQFMVVCSPLPGIRQIVAYSERHRVDKQVFGAILGAR